MRFSSKVYRRFFYLISTSFIFLLLAFVQLGNQAIFDGDGYFHIRYAQMLRIGLPKLSFPFPWLPLTILNPKDFADHHLLFHLLLMPFTFGNLIIGAKVAAVIFATGSILTWFLIANLQKVKYPFFWLLVLIASSSDFLFRLSMVRRQSLVLLLLLLSVHLILTRRLKWLVLLGFLFVWLYDGWILLIAVSLIASLGVWVEQKKVDLKIILAPLFGLLLGIVFNPFFPNNFIFSLKHLLPKINQDAVSALSFVFSKLNLPVNNLIDKSPIAVITVGGEWYPYPLDVLFKFSGLAIVTIIISLMAALWLLIKRKSLRACQIAWGGCAIFFTVMLFLSARFIEDQPAFAVMFAATVFTALVKNFKVRNIYYPLGFIAIIVLLIVGKATLFEARNAAAEYNDPPEKYADVSTWLENNSPPGALVFTDNWNQFPLLFFHNTKNTYLLGLDPYYLYQYSPELYKNWLDISDGNVKNPSQIIASKFKSNLVFIDEDNTELIDQSKNDPNMVQVYQDKWATIFKINDLK